MKFGTDPHQTNFDAPCHGTCRAVLRSKRTSYLTLAQNEISFLVQANNNTSRSLQWPRSGASQREKTAGMLTPTVANRFNWLYAVGNTPATSLTRSIPHGQDADILSLGCGDLRNIFLTAYVERGLGELPSTLSLLLSVVGETCSSGSLSSAPKTGHYLL